MMSLFLRLPFGLANETLEGQRQAEERRLAFKNVSHKLYVIHPKFGLVCTESIAPLLARWPSTWMQDYFIQMCARVKQANAHAT